MNKFLLRAFNFWLFSSIFIAGTDAQDHVFELESMVELVKNALASFEGNSNLNNQILSNMSEECAQKFNNFTSSLKNRTQWALRVFDAYGKPTSGILEGSTLWIGEYSECIAIKQPEWNWKYCSVIKAAGPSSLSNSAQYDMCLPGVCNKQDIAWLVNHIINTTFPNMSLIDSSNVQCQETKELDWSAILMIIFISFIVCLVIMGTVLDLSKTYLKTLLDNRKKSYQPIHNEGESEKLVNTVVQKKESLVSQILLSFSAYSNTKRIFTIGNTDGQLECLNGVRFFSIAWVILGHTYRHMITVSNNPLVALNWLNRTSMLIIANGTFSVDSFFLLSGILTGFLFMKETSRGKKINVSFIIKYYVHRYIRITPPYMVMVFISLTLTKYIGSGPFYPPEGFEPSECKYNWWHNLLYINNLYDPFKMCFIVSWYLGNDMQFHWLSPIILIPLALNKPIWKLIGLSVSVFLIVGSIIATAIVFHSLPLAKSGLEIFRSGMNPDVYNRPWCRISPFIIGILLGYLIFLNKKQTNKNIPLSETTSKGIYEKCINIIFMMLAFILCGLALFGPHGDFVGYPLNPTANLLYQSTSKTLWTIGVAYIIFACLTSRARIINSFLSWWVWIPLARLSFGAFLVHIPLIFYYKNTLLHPVYYQNLTMAFLYVSFLIGAFLLSFVFNILFEIPFASLEKFIFKK